MSVELRFVYAFAETKRDVFRIVAILRETRQHSRLYRSRRVRIENGAFDRNEKPALSAEVKGW